MTDDKLDDLNAQGLALLEKARAVLAPLTHLRGTRTHRRQRAELIAVKATVTSDLISALSWVQERRATPPSQGVAFPDAVLASNVTSLAAARLSGLDQDMAGAWRELLDESQTFCACVVAMDAVLQSHHAA